MQDLLAELFWDHEEISERADQLCRTIPGYFEAKQRYEDMAEKIQAIVGYDLYDEFFTQLMRYTNYEVCAYYAFGLGLREDVVRALDLK